MVAEVDILKELMTSHSPIEKRAVTNHRAVVQSDIEGGVYLRDLPAGAKLEVQTENRSYTIVQQATGQLISGHPEFCPEPTLVKITGSTWGGSMLREAFIGRGMRMIL